ncbi:MAG: dephospho-CoA kinase [Alphaproteobacteria bacterium]
MKIIGLTGSIGMGKTTIANLFAQQGAEIFNADAVVHHLLDQNAAIIDEVRDMFPEAVKKGQVDRKKLGEIVFSDTGKRKRLEELLHPPVFEEQDRFLLQKKREGAALVVLEIPLLFETGSDAICDITVVVSAPEEIQKERVMQRSGMDEDKFYAIIDSQMSDAQKRKLADYIVETDKGMEHSRTQVQQIIEENA